MLDKLPSWARYDKAADTWTIDVRIQPGAKFNEISGDYAGRLKLKIAAPAVDNKANAALVHFVAKLAGVGSGKVAILRGEHARQKTLAIKGAGSDFLQFLGHQED